MMSHQQQRQQQQYQMVGGGGGGNNGGGGQFGDTTYTKIFVGGLAWETQRETMRNYFEQFGDIQEAVVITDKNTGRSKGYGFVTFKDPDAALRACENPSPVIDGRRANCNLASLGAHRNGGGGGGGGGGSFTPQHGMGRYRPAVSGSQSNYQASSSMYLHQPAQYAFPYSAYGYSGYSQENMYPMNYYSLYGGGQPYYTTSAGGAATSASPVSFPNFYPFYSQGYGFQYHPQMVHYPYMPQNNHNSTGILSLPSSVSSSTSTTTGVAAIAAAVAGTDSATSPVSETTTKQNSSVPCS